MSRFLPPAIPRSALIVALVVSLAACASANAGNGVSDSADPSTGATKAPTKCTISKKLVPSCGAWWGVTPSATAGQHPFAQVHAFEREIGRPVDVYHGYHTGKQLFPTADEIALTTEPGEHRMLLLNWKPDIGVTWRQVAQGAMDTQIAREASYLKTHFRKKFWLIIHHEPEEEVSTRPGSGHTAQDYRAMFRHVVEQFRAHGSNNILFTMVFMGYTGYMAKPWFKDLYPGDDVVDWIGYDPFAKSNIADFAELLNKVAVREQPLGFPGFYDYAERYLPDKPLMLTEWAVLNTPGDPNRKPDFFRSVAEQFGRFPRIKALSYYDTPHAVNMPDGGNTSIDSSNASLRAFRTLSRRPEFNVGH
jgi:hypothetical protein